MKKNDLKKLVFCGAALGLMSVSQSASAHETEKTGDLLASTEKTHEELLAGGCQGKSGCGGQRPYNPQNTRPLTDEEEYNRNQGQGSQGQGQNHSCANRQQQIYQGRVV